MTEIRQEQIAGGLDGWIDANETWTYASADDPTYTFTISGDLSSKYSAGMRIKLTQTTVKYFIITAVSYSSPNTTITVYGGTDYDLASATITSPYYSMVKAPQGFPLERSKWTVPISASGSTQADPASGTLYNTGGRLDIPVGSWELFAFGYVDSDIDDSAGTYIYTDAAIGTANNTNDIVSQTLRLYVPGSTVYRNAGVFSFILDVDLTTKDSYYLNSKVTFDGDSDNLIMGVDRFEVVCAYL